MRVYPLDVTLSFAEIGAHYLRDVVGRTRAAYPEVRIVLVGMEAPTNMGPAYTEGFRDVFPRLARELDTGFVPFLLEGVAAEPELNQADGMHPNARGHEIMADNAAAEVVDAVRAATANVSREGASS